MEKKKPLSKKLSKGYLTAFAGTIFLSTTAIFIHYLTINYELPTLVLALWRDVFVVLTLLPIFLITKPSLLKIPSKNLLFLFLFGFVLAAFNASWTFSVRINGPPVATVLVYSSAAFTSILGWLLLKEQINARIITAVILCLLGCVLVADAYQLNVWKTDISGILVGLLSGFSYAAYTLMGRRSSQKEINPWTALFYTFLFAGLIFLLITLFPGNSIPGSANKFLDIFWKDADLRGWIVLFLLGAIPTVLGFGLYNTSLQFLPSSVVNLIATSEPLFTATFSYFLFRETLAPIQILGGFLVILGVLIIRFQKNR